MLKMSLMAGAVWIGATAFLYYLSRSENSYGIYIVHFVFVTWIQYLLLGNGLAPLMKGIVLFVGTLILSWVLVATIRRIPAVAKVI
jgi:surface polysaccharide O-acyltransferase-like enzyme